MQTSQDAITTTEGLAATREPLCVLVVDDDELYLKLIERLLSRDANYAHQVTVVTDAHKAVKLCSEKKFDIILIDYNLPQMSGLECLDIMRQTKQPGASMPPAILCTAEGNETIARNALQADVDDYIPKRQVNQSSLCRAIGHSVTKHKLKVSLELQFLELVSVNQELEKKNRETSNFYQTISHEVKTPLASAREFISLVRDGVAGAVSPEQINLLDYALSSCDQLTRHFNDLVDITKFDLKKLPLKKSLVSVKSILDISVSSCADSIRRSDGKVTVNNEAELTEIFADETRIIQVLSNLIGNAIKYSVAAPEIVIDVKNDGDNFIFTVSDNGCGIRADEKDLIFEKLYQTNKANADCLGAGIGLGLTIAKEIVSLHGGKIWLESELEVGSSFFFTIPIPA